MTDMSSAIVPKSDQISADDLLAGPRTIRITNVEVRSSPEQPVSIFYENDNGRPWKPCKSMSRVLVAAWGPDAKAYVGRSVTLYRDPTVKWGGMQVGGIRISHMTNIDKQLVLALTETKGKRAPFVVKPLAVPSAPTEQPRHIPDSASTHPTATLQARADKLEIALKGAGTLARLTAVWQAGRDLRTDLEAGDSIRHASLLALYNRLDLELEAAAGGFPGDEQ